MSSKVGIIIQCRINSTRLPGKSLMKLGDKSLIEHTYWNAIKSREISDCIVAIPEDSTNLILADFLENKKIPFIQGSPNNLVQRHIDVAKILKLDYIVRIPGDNPLPHANEIDQIIKHHLKSNLNGFSSNLSEVFDSGYPDGIGAEIFSESLLSKINQKEISVSKLEHPHLNFFDYEKQKAVNSVNVSTVRCPIEYARPDIRLDINTIQDFKYFSQMFDFFAESNFYIGDIIKWHDAHFKEIR